MNVNTLAVAGWLLRTAAGGGLLLLLTWGLMARTRQPALRQRLGEWGLASALAAALLSLGPSWLLIPWRGQPSTAAEPTAELRTGPRFVHVAADELPGEQPEAWPGPIEAPAAQPADEAEALSWAGLLQGLGPWAVLAYAAGAGLLLGRWLLGQVALARLLCKAAPAPAGVLELFRQMAGRPRAPRLLVSSQVRVPISCGLLRPTVVLPAELSVAPDPGALCWAFQHELTHLTRRDAWSGLLFAVGQAVFFYLPWFWPVRRQVRLCQEYVADAAAAGQGGAADYAEFLLSLAGAPAVPLGATGVSGHSSDLFRRVTMLLQDPLRVEPRCPRRRLLAAAGGLFGLAVLVAGVGVRAEGPPTIIVITGDASPRVGQVPPPPLPPLAVPVTPGVPHLKAGPVKILLDEPGFRTVHVRQAQQLQQVADNLFYLSATLPEPALDALKKALEQLRQNPDKAELDRVRRDIEKAIAYLQAHQPQHPPGQIQSFAIAPTGRRLYAVAPAGAIPPRLGVAVEKPSPVLAEQLGLPEGQGLVITGFTNPAAERAGLKANDILLELNGKPVPSDPAAFPARFAGLEAGATVSALVLRKGKREEVKGLVVSAPADQQGLWRVQVGQPPAAAVQARLVPTSPVPAPAKGALTTTRTRAVEQFTTRYQEGDLKITVTGAVEGGNTTRVFEIAIQEGNGPTRKYGGVDTVPAQYRERVRQLIETSAQAQERGDLRRAVPLEIEMRTR